MRNLKRLLVIGIICVLATAAVSSQAAETSLADNKAVFTKPLIWRADGTADYWFKGASLSNVDVAKDGSITSSSSEGTCELPNSYKTDGSVTSLAANWSFTGKVTLEVSTTGNSKDYIKVTNGVPVHFKESASGNRIKWRASLEPNSSLKELKIVYSDLSGVVGSFGNELLSGFSTRRQIYIKGSSAGELFNYQMPIKIGESDKSASPCDIRLNGGILSDFSDIRFTAADGETIIPHYVEEVTGASPDRVAYIWIKIPQIPKDGLPIYMYYGKAAAADLSDGDKVFDFFDDFNGNLLNPKKWQVTLYDKEGKAEVAGSLLSLELAKVTTLDYKFASGLIEYRAGAAANGAATAIIRSASSDNDDIVAYSSVTDNSAHAITKGTSVKTNDPRPISAESFYTYRIYCDDNGEIAFRRYDESGIGSPLANAQYSAGPANAMPIGLSPANRTVPMYCKWIRVRQAVYPPPKIDEASASSGVGEAANLPEFYNVIIASDGSLATAENVSKGYYISKLISPGFETRILKPSWQTKPSGEDLIGVSIATKEGGKFYTKWENGKTKYVSKKEFDRGSQLRYKVDFGTTSELLESSMNNSSFVNPKLEKFSLEFYSGIIRIVLPNGGEEIAPKSKYSIFWNAAGYGPDYPMEISYSKSGKRSFKVIAAKVSNSGDYAWDVPDKTSAESAIKVADYYDKSVYGISEDYFSITSTASSASEKTATGEVAASSEATASSDETKTAGEETKVEDAKKEKKSLAGQYDLLIKIGDSTSEGGYKDGDIVMVKPAGYLWGAEEKGKFLIIRAHLTPERAEELMKPNESVTLMGKSDRRVVKVLNKRKYRINMQNKLSLQERAAASYGKLDKEPVEIADITAATEKKR